MKLILWNVSLFFLGVGLAQAAESRESAVAKIAAQQAISNLTQAKSVGQVLSLTQHRLREADFKFISAQAAALKNEKVEIRQTGPFKIAISARHTQVEFELVDPVKRTYRINNQEYRYFADKPIERVWKEVEALLPTEISSSALDFLIPPAHAFGLAGVVIVAGVAFIVDSAITCSAYSHYTDLCLAHPEQVGPPMVDTATGVARHWETMCPLPGKKKKLLECLRDNVVNKYSSKQKSEISPANRKLLGIDLSEPKPADGGVDAAK